jgi:hypothetical protein
MHLGKVSGSGQDGHFLTHAIDLLHGTSLGCLGVDKIELAASGTAISLPLLGKSEVIAE